PQISRNYRGQLDGVAGNQAVPGNNDLTLKRLKELAGVPGQPKTPGELADIVRRRQAGSADPPGLPGAAGGAPAGGPATMPGLGRFSALARRERGLEEKYQLLTPQSPPMSGGLAEAKPTGAAAKPEVAEKEAKDAKEGPAREAGLKLADAEKGPADEPKPEPTVPAAEPAR